MRALPGVLAAALLAGCLAPAAPSTDPLAPTEALPVSPPLGRGPAAADVGTLPGESEATAWVRAHWGANASVVLLDEAVSNPFPLASVGDVCITCTFYGWNLGGTVVAPGTAKVELLVNTTAQGTAEARYFALLHTAGRDDVRVDFRDGAPGVYELQRGDADAPMQRGSAWWLTVHPYQEPVGIAATGTGFRLTLLAHRAAELPVFPPSPDRWDGRDALTVIEPGAGLTHASARAGPLCTGCYAGWWPEEGKLVPPRAAVIRATLSWEGAAPSPPHLYAWVLHAESWREMVAVEEGATSRTFEFAVPEDWPDSPFQERSGWSFHADLPGEPVGAAAGAFTLVVEALRAAPASEAPQPS